MQQDNSANNKRIAKNTLLLYVRMLFLMLISLYTSRVILNALGVEDYGIYNVVGGFVSLFTVLCGSLSTSISRFITFELGKKNNIEKLNRIFSTAVSIQAVLASIILVIAEIIGMWFINSKMVLPPERIYAAYWVFQFSVLTFCIQLLSVPYNAAIIAHERMSAFAYISIIEAVGKLMVAYAITIGQNDRLIMFGLLIAIIQIFIRFLYGIYCSRHFEECRWHPIVDKPLISEMFGFAGWTFIGSSAIHLRDQGGNILINLFFGPTVNAASGISMKVNSVVQQFVLYFMMAINPQIIKSYAKGEYNYMFKLIFVGSRASFYLILLLSLPVLLNTETILYLWLGDVPKHTSAFVKLLLILLMSDTLSNPIITAQSATGKIRNYQIVVGGALLMNLPIVYIFFKLGYAAEYSLITAIAFSQICLFLRLYMFKMNVKSFSIKQFLVQVYLNVIIVSIVASFIPIVIAKNIETNILSLLYLSVICIITTSLSIFFLGLRSKERLIVLGHISKFFKRYY